MKALVKNLLNELLGGQNYTFYIPPYQRNYEWTEEQCKVFLDDVVKTSQANQTKMQSEHFFGSITFFCTDPGLLGAHGKLVLIDGQQRVTTTMLFMAALRDVLDDESWKSTINRGFLLNQDGTTDGEYKIKLKQVETDWEDYRAVIIGEDTLDSPKQSRVWQNYRYFYQRLKAFKEKGGDLRALIEKGLVHFTVVTIELEPEKNRWENPQEIFESMNSLGKPLSLGDLVRNFLLLGRDAETQDFFYNQYWLKIERAVSGFVSNYIRDYMQFYAHASFKQASETNYKALYSEFKRLYEGKDVSQLLSSLAENARIYAYIACGEPSGNGKIDKILNDLRDFKITTSYSFLLALLAEWKAGGFTDQEIVEILEVFRVYCMRRRLLKITAAENKNFPLLAKRIPELKESGNKREAMFKILARQEYNLRLPNDAEVRQVLYGANFFNTSHCDFFLALIEESLTKSRPDLNDSRLQVEHIMPQTLSPEWRAALGPDAERIHQELVNSIGNLTLIRHNQELGNKPFEEKKETYENNAGLQIARAHITDRTKWDAEAITKRMEWMVEYLLDNILIIPDNMREKNNFVVQKQGKFSFESLGLIGEEICFYKDPEVKAVVDNDSEVIFEDKKWRLSKLTLEIMTRRGEVCPSGAYKGPMWWKYEGKTLAQLMKQKNEES